MRIPIRCIALAVAAGAVLCAPGASHADTGGTQVYFHRLRDVYTASVAHPDRHSLLPRPRVQGARHTYVEEAVPSPNGRFLAEVVQTGARDHWVFIAGPRGEHPRRAFHIQGPTPAAHHYYVWRLQGLSWAGNSRLYFSSGRYDSPFAPFSSSLRTLHVSRHGVPGSANRVPDTDGLTAPTTSPKGTRLAALRIDSPDCAAGAVSVASSTIVVLNLSTGHQRDLLTVTSTPALCPEPITGLAWSPEGSQIAFVPEVSSHGQKLVSQIDVIRVDGSDSQTPRVAVPSDDRHLFQAPAWQSGRRLWFTRELRYRDEAERAGKEPDLYSVGYRKGHFSPIRRETHTFEFGETLPTFG